MRQSRVFLILFLLLIVVVTVGMIWLSSSPMMPTPQKMEQAIPDDHIPR